MKLKFTHHAQYRMDERSIAVSNIKSALQNPDSVDSVSSSKFLARKNIGGKTLEVVYTKDKSEFVIITIYEV